MLELPAELAAALPAGSQPVAEAWWATLGDDDRQRIATLWDERLEVRFFERQAEDGWDNIPDVEGGRFVPHDHDGRGEWVEGYFEHLLQHPELMIGYEIKFRTFHLGCTIHSTARACITAGRVPTDFHCPFDSESCPMRLLRGAELRRVNTPHPVPSHDRASL